MKNLLIFPPFLFDEVQNMPITALFVNNPFRDGKHIALLRDREKEGRIVRIVLHRMSKQNEIP